MFAESSELFNIANSPMRCHSESSSAVKVDFTSSLKQTSSFPSQISTSSVEIKQENHLIVVYSFFRQIEDAMVVAQHETLSAESKDGKSSGIPFSLYYYQCTFIAFLIESGH